MYDMNLKKINISMSGDLAFNIRPIQQSVIGI